MATAAAREHSATANNFTKFNSGVLVRYQILMSPAVPVISNHGMYLITLELPKKDCLEQFSWS